MATRAVVTRASESAQPPDPPPSSQPAPDTPPPAEKPVASSKKKAPTHGKKKGRNQYTKDRDNNDHEGSPARSMSRNAEDNGATSHPTKSTSHETGHGSGATTTKSSGKSKGGINSKVSMGELKRRANLMFEYISRTQLELVNEPLAELKEAVAALDKQTKGDKDQDAPPNGDSSHQKTRGGNSLSSEFKDLNCIEMMDVLSRDIMRWQKEFAPS